MPLSHSTVADLRRAGIITSTEIVAAIDRYMHDRAAGPYRFASGHSIDIATAVAASPEMPNLRQKLGPHEKVQRNAVAAVVMAARVTPPGTTG